MKSRLKNKITLYLKRSGLNVNQLARLSGVSAPILYRFMSDQRDMVHRNAEKVDRFIDKAGAE